MSVDIDLESIYNSSTQMLYEIVKRRNVGGGVVLINETIT